MAPNARLVALSVAGAAVAFAVGAWSGRCTAPERIVERTKTVTVERQAEASSAATQAAQTSDVREVVRWRTRYVRTSQGAVEITSEAESGKAAAASSSAEAAATAARVAYRDRVEFRERIVESPRPSWALQARAGLQLKAPDLKRPELGLELQHRIVGGLWGGFWIQTGLADPSAVVGGASARAEW